MWKPSVINAPFGGAPEKAPRWDLMGTESCGSGNRVLAPYMMFPGYMSIYRRKWSVRRATRGPRGCRAPPASCPPRWLLYVDSKSSGSCLFQKSRSRRFHSVWTPFDILFLRNTEIGTKTTIWAGPAVNRLVPKII